MWRFPRLDVFVIGHCGSAKAGFQLALDTQLGVMHTFTHFAVLCTFWAFPGASVFVTESVPSSVGVVADSRHTFWEAVVILNILPSGGIPSPPLV